MLKIWKIRSRLWVDEKNVIYKKCSKTRVETSDGRVLRAPRPDAPIFVDGHGNGFLFA